MEKVVHVVHCVDAEGPLYESLQAKFERLYNIFGIRVESTAANLDLLLQKKLDLCGKEDMVREVFSSHLNDYMDSWPRVETMLAKATSAQFRTLSTDSFGGGYVYNWFCLDHVDYAENPRRRTMGYHAIFDFYQEMVEAQGGLDGLYWHFHPMSTYHQAHRCATSLLNSPQIWQTLARRVIERRWFPCCARAGFQTERPDIHWFLEQYVPFDFSNTAVEDDSELEAQADLAQGRFGDWRLAPKDWGVYHPDHDYYQLPGQCRRVIARALNVLNRFANLNQYEVDKAFAQASQGLPTLLAVASHDFRDLSREAEYLRSLLAEAARRHSGVGFKFCKAKDAMQAVALNGSMPAEPLALGLELVRDAQGKPLHLVVSTQRGRVFGPQPFLAIKTRSQRFIHDNLDFSTDLKTWRYVFDVETVLSEDVAAVGVGACDAWGNTAVEVLNLEQ